MSRLNVHKQTMCTYIIHTILRDLFTPSLNLEDLCRQYEHDLPAILTIKTHDILGDFPYSFTDDGLFLNLTSIVRIGLRPLINL